MSVQGEGNDLVSGVFAGAVGETWRIVSELVLAYPLYAAGLAVVLALVIAVKIYRVLHPQPKDTQRLFTKKQRKEGFARAGDRCEMVKLWFFRCSSNAQHGDHHYPHSKGGATSMLNFVALCAKCNLAKSAHVPSGGATRRLERKRGSYFPQGVPVTAGEWMQKPSRKQNMPPVSLQP